MVRSGEAHRYGRRHPVSRRVGTGPAGLGKRQAPHRSSPSQHPEADRTNRTRRARNPGSHYPRGRGSSWLSLWSRLVGEFFRIVFLNPESAQLAQEADSVVRQTTNSTEKAMKSKSSKAMKPKKTVKPARKAVTKSARKTAMPKPKARKVVKSAAPARKAPPRATAPKPNLEQDRAEILAVSKMWWDANRKFSIPMMCEAFVGGEKFHGFNLNGHTYYGIDEWVRLWEHLGTVMAPVDEAAAAALSEPRDVRLEIRGDMACLSAESTFTIRVLP